MNMLNDIILILIANFIKLVNTKNKIWQIINICFFLILYFCT